MLLTHIAVLDEVLGAHAAQLNEDFTAYRNHTYRVVNLCTALCPCDAVQVQKIAVAAAFHDLGIWTARTFDYLEPSVDLACCHLAQTGKEPWTPEVSSMILQHHKISRYRNSEDPLVEPFRQADWVDVSWGLRKFGLPPALLNAVFATWPDAGFRWRLVQLSARRLRTHPRSPLPMLRL